MTTRTWTVRWWTSWLRRYAAQSKAQPIWLHRLEQGLTVLCKSNACFKAWQGCIRQCGSGQALDSIQAALSVLSRKTRSPCAQ